MKISKVTGLHVKTGASGSRESTLSRLQVGQKVMASVIKKLGPTRALLDIRGGRIDATFKDGVPDVNRLILKLEHASGDRYVFKIEHGTGRAEMLRNMAELSVFGKDAISDGVIRSLADRAFSMSGGMDTLYMLNRILHELISGQAGPDRTFSSLLNILLKKGVSSRDCIIFSFLFTRNTGILTEMVQSLLPGLLFKNEKEGRSRFKLDSHVVEKAVESVFDAVKDDPDAKVLTSMIYDLLAGSESDGPGSTLKHIPVYEDGMFSPAGVVMMGDSLLLSLDLSKTGLVEIMIRSETERISIQFYCYKEEGMNMLRGSQKELVDILEHRFGKKVELGFFNPDEIKEKIIAINQNLVFTSGLDITV